MDKSLEAELAALESSRQGIEEEGKADGSEPSTEPIGKLTHTIEFANLSATMEPANISPSPMKGLG